MLSWYIAISSDQASKWYWHISSKYLCGIVNYKARKVFEQD